MGGTGMAWWDRIASPVKRAWAGVSARIGMRQSGLMRLRHEVSTCEYEDVQVMWELLTVSGRARPLRSPAGARRKRGTRGTRERRRGERSRAWHVLELARFGICGRL